MPIIPQRMMRLLCFSIISLVTACHEPWPSPDAAPDSGQAIHTESVLPAEFAPSRNLVKFVYDPSDRWDPFVAPGPREPLSPICESYNLEQLRLLGTIRGSNMDGALVLFPDGSNQIVRVNDNLGRHGGVITKIGENNLLVEEKFFVDASSTLVRENEIRMAAQ